MAKHSRTAGAEPSPHSTCLVEDVSTSQSGNGSKINPSWQSSRILLSHKLCKQTGMEAIEGLCFLASFGPPGTGKRKGGEKTQPFNCFDSHPGTVALLSWAPIPQNMLSLAFDFTSHIMSSYNML